ncbi:MAG: thioredoxin family protein [Chromatiales bacterium]|nr:thioredoxin family protein [Chromatiales bacterium]
MQRLTSLILALVALTGFNACADARPPVPLIQDLRAEAVAAREQKLPILIEFALDHCPYCHHVEDVYLRPMIASGDYAGRVLIRKLHMDARSRVIDFDGRQISGNELAARYRVRVAPTVVLVDAQGEVLAKPLVGVSIPDYYGGYLEDAIDSAFERLRTGMLAKAP